MMCERPFVKNISGKIWGMGRTTTIPLPCGRCLHCRINRSRMWQSRILFESMAHNKSCFVTLTYDNDNLPCDMENLTNPLRKKDLQNYLKKLRRLVDPIKIRYYACGEYGDQSWRPHFHLMIFGLGIEDKKVINFAWNSVYNRKKRCYEIRNKGYIWIGDVTRESARYVTQYVTKDMKIYDNWYYKLIPDEFATMSKMDGGLGIKVIEEAAKKMEKLNVGVVETFNIKGKDVNLGRYLKRKLHEKRGLSEKDFDGLFYLYQRELYDKHQQEDGCFIENFMDEDRIKRMKRVHNLKTFRKKGRKI